MGRIEVGTSSARADCAMRKKGLCVAVEVRQGKIASTTCEYGKGKILMVQEAFAYEVVA